MPRSPSGACIPLNVLLDQVAQLPIYSEGYLTALEGNPANDFPEPLREHCLPQLVELTRANPDE